VNTDRSNTENVTAGPRIGAASVRAAVLTRAVGRYAEPNRGLCGRCRGTKFDGFEKARGSTRKCPACKGAGSVPVGSTKR
jgi:hypothetical protein